VPTVRAIVLSQLAPAPMTYNLLRMIVSEPVGATGLALPLPLAAMANDARGVDNGDGNQGDRSPRSLGLEGLGGFEVIVMVLAPLTAVVLAC
jgi:hypothetical protein